MKHIAPAAILLFTLPLLLVVGSYNYLLFHSIAEIFAVIIACGIFMVAWNSRHYVENHYLLFVGCAYLFIGILDLVHTLTYDGMNILTGYGVDTPTQLWIAARYLESLTLLVAPVMLHRRFRPVSYPLVYGVITLLLLVSILHWRNFPHCYLESAGGLTLFKKISEYIICLILLAAGIMLLKYRRFFDPSVLGWMLASILFTILSELTFTAYIGVYSFVNLLGHCLKIVSFYCIYRAIIQTGLTKPIEVLFRDLNQSKQRYHDLFTFMIEGFADHQVVLDKSGKPVDYIFLEVNEAFERLTGLKEVVGRRVTEVLPGIHQESQNWIEVYGNVALSGESLRLESYSQALGKWFAISSYSYQHGRFVSIFEDITLRKQAEEDLVRSEARFKLLSDTAGGLLATEDPLGLVQNLCQSVMTHLDCQTFFNFLVDDEVDRLHLNACDGISAEAAAEIEWLDYGSAVCGCVAREKRRIIAQDILNTPDLRTELIKSYGIQAYCCHPLLDQGRLIGTLSFGTRTRPAFSSEEIELMRIVSDQVALAIQRLQTRQRLHHANEFLELKIRERTRMLAHTVDTLEAEIDRRKQAEAELKQANQQLYERAAQLRALSTELTMTEQRERKRLAKVLHDGLQQHLAAAKLQLGAIIDRLDDKDGLKSTVVEIENLLVEGVQMSRSLSAELSPPVLFRSGLRDGLKWLAQWMEQKHRLHVDLDMEPGAELPEDMNVLLFESVRELLFNTVKHAGTDRAGIQLTSIEDGRRLRIVISDQGRGFDVHHMKPIGGQDGGGFGLFSIRERLDSIGGSFEIASAPGQGSHFTMTVGRSDTVAKPYDPSE